MKTIKTIFIITILACVTHDVNAMMIGDKGDDKDEQAISLVQSKSKKIDEREKPLKKAVDECGVKAIFELAQSGYQPAYDKFHQLYLAYDEFNTLHLQDRADKLFLLNNRMVTDAEKLLLKEWKRIETAENFGPACKNGDVKSFQAAVEALEHTDYEISQAFITTSSLDIVKYLLSPKYENLLLPYLTQRLQRATFFGLFDMVDYLLTTYGEYFLDTTINFTEKLTIRELAKLINSTRPEDISKITELKKVLSLFAREIATRKTNKEEQEIALLTKLSLEASGIVKESGK